jgi:hypothetical protein
MFLDLKFGAQTRQSKRNISPSSNMNATRKAADKIRIAKAIAGIAEAHSWEVQTLDGRNIARTCGFRRNTSR